MFFIFLIFTVCKRTQFSEGHLLIHDDRDKDKIISCFLNASNYLCSASWRNPHSRIWDHCFFFTFIFLGCFLLFFFVSFYYYLFGFSLQVMRTRQDGAMVKQDLFETTKYYQGQPWSHDYLHYMHDKRQISVWAARIAKYKHRHKPKDKDTFMIS